MAARVTAISILSLVIAFTVFLNFSSHKEVIAAAAGDYRSAGSGDWNNVTTWQTYNGTSWISAPTAPSLANGAITIQSGHTVTITANITIDQVTVSSGGKLTISGGTLTIANGTGSDLGISGTVEKNAGTVIINSGAQVAILSGGIYNFNGGVQSSAGWAVNNGGTYVHNVDDIVIPAANWGSTATLKITGTISSDVTGTYQSFGHVIYDCPNQIPVSIGGDSAVEFTDELKSVAGNFTVLSTGAGSIRLQRSAGTIPVSISGNYVQSGGTVFMSKDDYTLNVMGNFTLSNGTFAMAEKNGIPILNIYGTFSISGGTFNHSMYGSIADNEGIGTVNLYGNYIRTGGLQTETSEQAGHGEFNFVKSGTQTFAYSGGAITNTVNFTVVSGSVLSFTGGYRITGGGAFTLQSGGGLILGSINGIHSAGPWGNIQVTGARNFSTGGDYTYAGTSPQVTGDGLPSIVHNLTFNNPNNVTMSGHAYATNILSLISGKVITNCHEVGTTNTSTSSIINYSPSSYVAGMLRRSVDANGSYSFPVGTLDNYELMSVNFSNMTGVNNILGFFTEDNPIEPSYPLTDVYVNSTEITGMLNYGYWTLIPNVTMTGGEYAVTLNEKGHSNSASSPSAYSVIKRNSISSAWQSVGLHNNNTQSELGGVATAMRSSLTSFSSSQFGIGMGGGPLPVTLAGFAAKKSDDEKTVLIDWITISEVNNDYFTIQRSNDGKHFSELTRVDGSGNTTIMHRYSLVDENPLDGTSYYRLKQTDFNGRTEIFKTVAVTIKTIRNTNSTISVFPNPFSDSFIARFESVVEQEANISIFSVDGILVFSENIIVESGNNVYKYENQDGLKEGTYLIMVNSTSAVIASGKIFCRK